MAFAMLSTILTSLAARFIREHLLQSIVDELNEQWRNKRYGCGGAVPELVTFE